MKTFFRIVFGAALLLRALPAFCVLSCSVTPNPAQVNVTHNNVSGATAQGSLNLTCTRGARDPKNVTLWIGMTQTAAGLQATLETGTDTINYEIYHASQNSGTWTDTGGVAATNTANQAVLEPIKFGGNSTSYTGSLPFYFTDAWLQFNKTAGVYDGSVPITVRLGSAAGALITTGSLDVRISVPKSCRFSSSPSISLNYPAFSPVPVTGTANFTVTCTLGTTYTLSLDANRSVVPVVELSYGLTLNAPANPTGNANAQAYSIDVSIDAGQAGRCSASTCSGTDTSRTLTITY